MGTATGDRRLASSQPEVRADGRRAPLGDRGPEIVRGIAIVLWVVVFSVLVHLRQSRIWTVDYDMGIHDQSVWLLAHFRGFSTVRGLQVFGHHATRDRAHVGHDQSRSPESRRAQARFDAG
jgi:hypothetical protein